MTILLFLLVGCARASAQNQAAPDVPASKDNHTHTANFGDLSVTARNVFVEDADHAEGKRKVTAFATLKNDGDGTVCASFIALLRTSSGSEYLGDSTFSLHIYDMLPGQSVDGKYLFDVKAGEHPSELIFELQGGTIRCRTSRNSARQDASIPKEIRLDVHDLPGLTPRAARPDEPTFRPGVGGVGYARCIDCPDPKYSEKARAAHLEGTVVLEAVVASNGLAYDVKVTKGIGQGLDEEAVKTVETWRVEPALGPNSEAVAIVVPIEITFRLSK